MDTIKKLMANLKKNHPKLASIAYHLSQEGFDVSVAETPQGTIALIVADNNPQTKKLN